MNHINVPLGILAEKQPLFYGDYDLQNNELMEVTLSANKDGWRVIVEIDDVVKTDSLLNNSEEIRIQCSTFSIKESSQVINKSEELWHIPPTAKAKHSGYRILAHPKQESEEPLFLVMKYSEGLSLTITLKMDTENN